jgi:hypothetical protein
MEINGMRPTHPGEILREEFFEPLDITSAALARTLHVSVSMVRISGRSFRGARHRIYPVVAGAHKKGLTFR